MVVFRLGQDEREPGPRAGPAVPDPDHRPARQGRHPRSSSSRSPARRRSRRTTRPINVDFLIYWRIVDPLKSVVNVANFAGRAPGRRDDDPARRHRRHPPRRGPVQARADQRGPRGSSSTRSTERWGGKVTTVEIREITPPRDVQDAMNRQLVRRADAARRDHRVRGRPPGGDQRRRGPEAGRDPQGRGRAPGRDPARRGLQRRR